MKTWGTGLEVLILQTLVTLQSYAFRINSTEASSSTRLTEEIYNILQTLLVTDGEQRVRLSTHFPNYRESSSRPFPENSDTFFPGQQDLPAESPGLAYWRYMLNKAQNGLKPAGDKTLGDLEGLLSYAYTKRLNRNRLQNNLENLQNDIAGSLEKRGLMPGSQFQDFVKAPDVKKWGESAATGSRSWSSSTSSHMSPSSSGSTGLGRTSALPEIYRDICPSYSEFELLRAAVNDAFQLVELLPNTYVWSTKCSRPGTPCSSIAPGVVARCRQKQAWVRAFARLDENDPWGMHWIAVDSSCNCAVRVGY